MRIVIDLDGTLCELRQSHMTYSELEPLPGAIEGVKQLKNQGHEIIIHTARNMKTQHGNVGKVIANVGKQTLDWLDRYEIPYDEVVFGKPYGEVYIDDLALSFKNWPDALTWIKEIQV
ncbi:HAD hydrolase family protein [Fictibacillus sp. KIGAM418]|uniref:HAD hydrolase family protein n=1 Tax=Fictibacillus marinisediminis TaxID=2878389 RepID=A0A9X2BG52_9BACL|nr:HAD hydrolase family protein [Fictibacillus marinisediminis]MCK6259420.1 HAD hydrolase family protein [Fictibacillus marinisediminis]